MSATIDYGIDLGTTNSSIALCRGGDVRIFQTNELMNVTPSVVYISKTGRMLVGRKAYDTWVQDPQNTQAEFKRWMGYSDKLTFPASGRSVSAEELSAEVLKSLRADAMRQSQEELTAAVITVPAAFGSLQCDATGRAAKMAGFEQCPLLQEPVAAAIAYGAGPSSQNQRWMVFDLGGGTLDIAVVSTRNGRLAVLEHQGNNRLGGKDFDKLIADKFFLTALRGQFNLPDRQADPKVYDKLYRALVRHAEQVKIQLSSGEEATAELFELGEDRDGKMIEAVVTVKRSEVEIALEPLLDQCIDLAKRALDGARLSKDDLDRTLLVGGPTQMPILRAALENKLGAKLDYSLDPMTVVARGAALYASTIEKTVTAKPPASTNPVASGAGRGAGGSGGSGVASSSSPTADTSTPPVAIPVQLSFERASGTTHSPVAGMIAPAAGVHEVKIDGEGGYWTSGWIPVTGGCFQIDVVLQDRKPVTQFTVTGRDKTGKPLTLHPGTFSITYMLPMAAPPLPHTIAVELSTVNGVSTWDPVFKRHCPLPAETRKTYRAERTLRPSDLNEALPIKFWEIEVSEDPQEKWWAGGVSIRADQITRPILEGSELELTIKIDTSRKMTVEAFVPLINQSFKNDVFVPDPPAARSQLQAQLDLCFARIDRLHRDIYETDRSDLAPRLETLQMRLESIYEQVADDQKRRAAGGQDDPDAALQPTESLRGIRIQLSQIEEQLETRQTQSPLAREVYGEARWSDRIISAHGSELDKTEMAKLQSQLEKYMDGNDARGLKWVQQQLRRLRAEILTHQPWWWEHLLDYCKRPDRRFLNKTEADRWMAQAERTQAQKNLPELRQAVIRMCELLPPDEVDAANEQAAQSGLRSE